MAFIVGEHNSVVTQPDGTVDLKAAADSLTEPIISYDSEDAVPETGLDAAWGCDQSTAEQAVKINKAQPSGHSVSSMLLAFTSLGEFKSCSWAPQILKQLAEFLYSGRIGHKLCQMHLSTLGLQQGFFQGLSHCTCSQKSDKVQRQTLIMT